MIKTATSNPLVPVATIRVVDLVERARASHPKVFGDLSDQRVAALARLIMQQLNEDVSQIAEGALKVPGFGNFVVRQVDKKGDTGDTVIRRVVFRPAKPKAVATNEQK